MSEARETTEPSSAKTAPPQPVPDLDSVGFWVAALAGRFALCRCQACRCWLHPPLERCRWCGGETEFEHASGLGTVYSYIVVHHSSVPAFAESLPYVIALVDLDEGVRLPGRMPGSSPDQVTIGQRVRVRLVDMEGGEQPAVTFAPHSVGRITSAGAKE